MDDHPIREILLSPGQREKFERTKNLEEIIRAADKLVEVIAYVIEGRNFKTSAETNAFLDQMQDKWNTTPRCELLEHSPTEVARLAYELPRQSDGVWKIDLSSFADEIGQSPLFSNWTNLLQYINSNQVGATAQGNLNQKTVNALFNVLDMGDMDDLHRGWIRNEFDWEELSVLRACAEFAGLIKRRKRIWSVTKRGRDLLAGGDATMQYLQLFDAWFNQLDWSSLYRNELLEKVGFQGSRFVVISGLLRRAGEWTGYAAFLRTLCCEFLRLECRDDESSLRYLFHYPLFVYLEKMKLLEICYRRESKRLFDIPDKMRVTPLGKYFISSLLSEPS
ncbi:MAG: hypothetical protein KAV87_58045 [Desulfobacteraceae bacterium]|nr:hypothetical protein [Desulfobacteraceae bacterium]